MRHLPLVSSVKRKFQPPPCHDSRFSQSFIDLPLAPPTISFDPPHHDANARLPCTYHPTVRFGPFNFYFLPLFKYVPLYFLHPYFRFPVDCGLDFFFLVEDCFEKKRLALAIAQRVFS